MALLKGLGDFFALDIGTSAVRVVQLSGTEGHWSLDHFGYVPVDSKVSTSDSAEAHRKLGEVITTAIGQSGIRSKNVVVGIPSQKTFITVIDVPVMPASELASTIRYQADQYIPMSIDEAKVDWVSLGQSLRDPKQQEVLLASTAISYAEQRLDFIESLGLNVIAAEPNPVAIVRSLLPAGASDARLVVDVGTQSTDIAITYGDTPRLVRTIPVGIESLVKAAVQNLNVQEDQAQQFIMKFGLAPDRLEGQVLHALQATLDNFTSELTKSVKFFQTRYPNIAVSGTILSGFGAVIPLFAEHVSQKIGIATVVGNPWQAVRVSREDQAKLAPVSAEFATVVGLAQRKAGS